MEVETKEPKIPFRETIQAKAEGSYRHKKQSGGRGQFGEVHIRMFPLAASTDIEEYATKANFPQLKDYHYDEKNNFLWVDSVVGGVIPGNFMPAIEKGFRERMTRGVIAGYQVQDVCVEVHFGKHHPRGQFRTGLQDGRLDGVPQRLSAGQADAAGTDRQDGHHRPGRQRGRRLQRHVRARRPRLGQRFGRRRPADRALRSAAAAVTTYARTLSSMTGGQGSYTMEFSHYDVMPPNVMQEIIAKAKLEEEEDD